MFHRKISEGFGERAALITPGQTSAETTNQADGFKRMI
jgi:hypothetical protein